MTCSLCRKHDVAYPNLKWCASCYLSQTVYAHWRAGIPIEEWPKHIQDYHRHGIITEHHSGGSTGKLNDQALKSILRPPKD